ncbi:hypothetical protein NA57DRAFT_74026 [Rhizodiscina lignyota]|uniref:Mitochondrial import inner membrane translocase subunit n=1 Tax=Rhizodiscina lignyota TaxID=1504668 RepID=A0A9P4IIU3_9PEZI|nr:hypothetical protein NA57DRAFT_74026 [Rhizodiscina lignyota]
MDSLSTGSLSGGDAKTTIMNQVRQEAAVANAKALIEKVNEHCFERCVPKPSTSLSRSEEGCYSACMEKYMAAWNAVSKQYVSRMQREQSSAGFIGGGSL